MKAIFVVCALFLSINLYGQGSEDAQVRALLEAFKSDEDSPGRAEKNAQYFDSGTLSYFSGLAKLTQTADESILRTLPYYDRFLILCARHTFNADFIRKWSDGKELLSQTIRNGWILRGLKNGECLVQNITFSGNSAIVTRGGNWACPEVQVLNESGEWKFSIIKLLPSLEEQAVKDRASWKFTIEKQMEMEVSSATKQKFDESNFRPVN